MEKKNIIITGANSGLGFACAELIAAKKDLYRIILACRNSEKAEKAKMEIIAKTGNEDVVVLPLDLESLASVRKFVKHCEKLEINAIYGLLCNAGISGAHQGITADGFDCIFQSNHLGHFLLTLLLLPMMQPDGRILVVSSDMHRPPQGELEWLGAERLAHPDECLSQQVTRYSYSKMCNLYFVYELAKQLKQQGSGIVINAFNPGLMLETNFAPNKAQFTEELLKAVADRIGSLGKSSKAMAALILEQNYGTVTGKYYDRSTEISDSSPLSYNKENAEELWKQSLLYAGFSINNGIV